MLWKIAPLAIGLLAAYLARGRAVHAALGQRRPFRATLIWLRAAVIAVPAVYFLAAIGLLIEEAMG